MPRVHHRKARKDYPNQGIEKGDMYYTWAIKMQRGGIVKRSKTYPKRSQLTLSDFLGQAYDLDDAVQEAPDIDTLRALADDIRSLGQEQQEKLDNMPEQLQYAASGELLQERIDQCEEWADSVEAACDEYENEIDDDDDLSDDDKCEAFDRIRGDIESPV
jgi:hypothetical protein